MSEEPLNQINMNIRGDVVYLHARLDLSGLTKLESKLAALKLILKPEDAEAVQGASPERAEG